MLERRERERSEPSSGTSRYLALDAFPPVHGAEFQARLTLSASDSEVNAKAMERSITRCCCCKQNLLSGETSTLDVPVYYGALVQGTTG